MDETQHKLFNIKNLTNNEREFGNFGRSSKE